MEESKATHDGPNMDTHGGGTGVARMPPGGPREYPSDDEVPPALAHHLRVCDPFGIENGQHLEDAHDSDTEDEEDDRKPSAVESPDMNKHTHKSFDMMEHVVQKRNKGQPLQPLPEEQQLIMNMVDKAVGVGSNLRHVLHTFICGYLPDATLWEKRMTLPFVVCNALNISLFRTLQKSVSVKAEERVTIEAGLLHSNGYDLTKVKVPALPGWARVAFQRLYSQLVEEHKKIIAEIQNKHMFTQYNQGPIGGQEPRRVNNIKIPQLPKERKFLDTVNYCRLVVWRLWVTEPRAERKDVRNNVMLWACQYMTKTKVLAEFEAILRFKVEDNIRRKAQIEDRQQLLPQYYRWINRYDTAYEKNKEDFLKTKMAEGKNPAEARMSYFVHRLLEKGKKERKKKELKVLLQKNQQGKRSGKKLKQSTLQFDVITDDEEPTQLVPDVVESTPRTTATEANVIVIDSDVGGATSNNSETNVATNVGGATNTVPGFNTNTNTSGTLADATNNSGSAALADATNNNTNTSGTLADATNNSGSAALADATNNSGSAATAGDLGGANKGTTATNSNTVLVNNTNTSVTNNTIVTNNTNTSAANDGNNSNITIVVVNNNGNVGNAPVDGTNQSGTSTRKRVGNVQEAAETPPSTKKRKDTDSQQLSASANSAPTASPKSPPTASAKTAPTASLKSPPPGSLKSPPPASLKSPPPGSLKSPPPASHTSPPPGSLKSPPPGSLKSPPPGSLKSPPPASLKSPPPGSLKSPPPASLASPPTASLKSPSAPRGPPAAKKSRNRRTTRRLPTRRNNKDSMLLTPMHDYSLPPQDLVRVEQIIGHIQELDGPLSATDSSEIQELLKLVTRDDPGLLTMLQQLLSRCIHKHNPHDSHWRSKQLFLQAVEGLKAHGMEEIFYYYSKHHDYEKTVKELEEGNKDTFAKLSAPRQVSKTSDCRIKFFPPGEDFTHWSLEALQVIQIFLKSCDARGVAPVRWNWIYAILQGLNLLVKPEELPEGWEQLLKFALLVCLILSAATPDYKCISSTIALFQNGLLGSFQMADSDVETIREHIHQCGIDIIRAGFLKETARIIRDQHGGRVPEDYVKLQELPGVGRKTAVLFLTEGCGIYAGIGCDKHVFECTRAFEWLLEVEGGSKVTPEHAEASLRTWVDRKQFPLVNKLFGSFAQLFTQTLRTVSPGPNHTMMEKVVKAMTDHLHEPMHVRLLWFMIGRVRVHYFIIARDEGEVDM